MKRMIDLDEFTDALFRAVFEEDSEMQRWDSGCWIRYKLFKNVLNKQTVYIIADKYCEERKLTNEN